MMSSDPSKFLSDITGKQVIVKLHNGVEYNGILQSIDGYMNIVLENTKEFITNKLTRSYEDVFIRGNNGEYFVYFFDNGVSEKKPSQLKFDPLTSSALYK